MHATTLDPSGRPASRMKPVADRPGFALVLAHHLDSVPNPEYRAIPGLAALSDSARSEVFPRGSLR